jgi:hypothetical protein
MGKLFFIILSYSIYINALAQNLTVSILSYGAKADGTIQTAAIQKAIDEVSVAGGGRVSIPEGEFKTGTIVVKSGVDLHLEPGAVLSGSDKRKDYDGFDQLALVIAVKQQNIAITGNGIIDGKGRELMKDIIKLLDEGKLTDPDWKIKQPRESSRVKLICFEDCENIKVKNVFFKDASSWVTHYLRCRNVTIDSIRLESVAYWNNDGIDVVDCKNMRITNSFINASDDAICLKSARSGDFCDSIYIEHCTLRSSANAFKLGTGSYGGFKNITVRNLTVFNTYRSAIALEAVDGGFLENIDIRDVTATNTGSAILIRLGHRNKNEIYSRVKNIYISNVKVEVPVAKPDAGYEMEGPLLMYPPGIKPEPGKFASVSPWNYKEKMPGAILYTHNVFPSSITGIAGHNVEKVILDNIEINYHTVADKKINYFPLDSCNRVTEATADYPEFSMFGELPVWGFYVRHVNGLIMRNVTLKMNGEDFRTAFLFNDVKKLLLKKIVIKGSSVTPAVFYNEVSKVKQSSAKKDKIH